MRIERIDAVFDGDNVSKKIKLYVDEEWRTLSVYLYFVPVVGDEVYTTANPITLDENGEAEYLIPGDVLNGEGVFGAQIVCIDTNGTEIAKSAIYTDECGQSIDDTSAVLPTGEVITLAQLFAKFDSLTASEVGYVDTEEIGVDNVQDAIDYALTHGGGGSIPTYTLRWDDNPAQYREYNISEVNRFRDKSVGSYELYLQMGVTDTRIEVYEIRGSIGGTLTMFFRGSWNGEQERIYRIICGTTAESYEQTSYVLPDSTFDASSLAAPSMFGTAEYIDERIGTTGNLDPDSYASASDVEAIESVIPSAASAQNQLADKAYVATELSGKQDTLTEAEQSAVDSGITSAKVSAYDAHVADTTIHVTSADKTAWNAKYDKPSNGIPSSDMTSAVQTSLGLADTALQSVPSGYATETYVDTAIDAAIGNAIGGSY